MLYLFFTANYIFWHKLVLIGLNAKATDSILRITIHTHIYIFIYVCICMYIMCHCVSKANAQQQKKISCSEYYTKYKVENYEDTNIKRRNNKWIWAVLTEQTHNFMYTSLYITATSINVRTNSTNIQETRRNSNHSLSFWPM